MSTPLSTSSLLSALVSLSSGKLACKEEVGLLYEAALGSGRLEDFEQLCFQAKFAYRTHGILARIGKDGIGAEMLQREFTAAFERVASLARILVESAPVGHRERFVSRCLALTPDAFQNLLTLCYDLSWYKNWEIDQKSRSSPRKGTPTEE